jgi:hypothetical protein
MSAQGGYELLGNPVRPFTPTQRSLSPHRLANP